MNDEHRIIENIKIGKLIIAITNFLTAIIFLVVYYFIKNILLLIPVVLLVSASIFVFFYYSKLQAKYEQKNENIEEKYHG
jgi:VIT1/CCC1 family predicted Fe2+/Mn2+ transporter